MSGTAHAGSGQPLAVGQGRWAGAGLLGGPGRRAQLWAATAGLLVLALLAGHASPGFAQAALPGQLARQLARPRHPAAHPVVPAAQQAGASPAALTDIPAGYRRRYAQAAAACPALSWQLLAAIGKVESDHGRDRATGVTSGANPAGAAGPMQFGIGGRAGNTWGGGPRHPVPPRVGAGRDGDGDGLADVYNPADAIAATAATLCGDGLAQPAAPVVDRCPALPGSPALHQAVYAYNHACWYVRLVLAWAARYAGPPPSPDPFVAALTRNPRLATSRAAGCDPAPDLASGRLDLRVQSLLAVLAERWSLQVSCLHSGHSYYVAGTRRVSNHTVWRAVDISRVDGQPVSPACQPARALVVWLDAVDGPLRPAEIGSPFDLGHRPYFTDDGHQDHLHIGYRAG